MILKNYKGGNKFMKKQFIMVPNMFDKDIIQVTKYVDGVWNDSFGILSGEEDNIKKELEADGWIYSVYVNYLQEQIKEYKDKIGNLCQMIGEAMEAGNYILEYDEDE